MSVIDRNPPRPGHEWTLTAVINLTDGEAHRLAEGKRAVLRKVDVFDRAQVRASAVICAKCQLTIDKLGDGELEECRG